MHGGRIEEWPDRTYRVEGKLADLQPEIHALRLCSAPLREILDAHKSPEDVLQWLPVRVQTASGDVQPYWILHFPEFPDVVDPVRSTYQVMNGQRFYNAVALDGRKAGRHAVMASPQRFPTVFVVSEPVRKSLLDARLTGLDFDEIPTTHSVG
jgi:hypothetical protein